MTTAPPLAELESSGIPPSDVRLLAQNGAALFAGQAVGLIVPLITIPYLARVLRPAAWGPVIAAQALANWLLIVLEFGFELSATRAVSRARTTPESMGEVVHGVQSAKAILSLSALPVILIGLLAIPAIRGYGALLGCAIAYAIFRGLSPLWFFQGIERVKGAVAVDTLTRAAAALAVFAVVHDPSDAWRVVALQAGFAGVALAILTRSLGRHVRPRMPNLTAGIETLRASSTIFACRAWSGLYIQGNALILSAFAGPAVVAFFGGAERIVRAATSLLQPLTQTFLPRVTYLQVVDPPGARRTVRFALLGVGLVGAVIGLCAYVGAPLLVHVILGPRYDQAVPVLRLLAALPLLVAVNGVLGVYWALPFGHDRWLLASIVAAGVTNFGLALVMVPRWGAIGMAAAATAAEVVALGVTGTLYLRSDR